jgi:hypothetical protein
LGANKDGYFTGRAHLPVVAGSFAPGNSHIALEITAWQGWFSFTVLTRHFQPFVSRCLFVHFQPGKARWSGKAPC